MFQFTTTNVINSNVDLSTGKALWTIGSNNIFRVKRVGNFKKENVTAIYKTKGYNGENAKFIIDLSNKSLAKEETIRLFIYVGLTQACQDSKYANDYYTKGKPFTVEFSGKLTAAEVEKLINKYQMFVFGEKLLRVSSSSNLLIVEATNEYQRFKEIKLERFVEFGENKSNLPSGEYRVIKSLKDFTVDKSNENCKLDMHMFPGKEGFGTYSYILHNLRIPTSMRTRAFGVNQDETPIPGALYDEYVIHYSTNRGTLGTNGVGDQVRSNTTHVFYVKQGLTATPETMETIDGSSVNVGGQDFDTAIKKLGKLGEITPMDTPEIPTEDPNPIITSDTINSAIAGKADKTYVDQELAKKQNIA